MADDTTPPVDPTKPQPTAPAAPSNPGTLENYFALAANTAMANGKDPKAVTDQLGQYVRNLRANPDEAARANAAIAAGKDPAAVAQTYLSRTPGDYSAPEQPGVFSQAGSMLKGMVPHSWSQAGQELEGMVTAPFKSAGTLLKASGEQLGRADLAESGGDPNTIQQTVSPKEIGIAAAQVGANALPFLGTAGRILAAPALGAAYNPQAPVAGAIAGAAAAPLVHGAVKVGVGIPSALGTMTLDALGRPAETMGAGPFKILSTEDRAAQMNAPLFAGAPAPNALPATSSKPIAPLDIGGAPAVRTARGLKVAFPGAEDVAQAALGPGAGGRAEGAVGRVIQDGLQLTGLQTRESGPLTVEDLIKQRSATANANWPQMYEANPDPIDDARLDKVWTAPAAKKAWQDVPELMANRFLPDPAAQQVDLSTLSPAKANAYRQLIQSAGGDVAKANQAWAALGEQTPTPKAGARPPMNLQQAHFWAQSLEDDAQAGFNRGPGAGGPKYGNARAMQDQAQMIRDALKDNVPDFAANSQQFADDSQLIDAAKKGSELYQTDPGVAARYLANIPAGAQDVYRRAAFDALAQRVENGPSNVERGVGKPLDQQRTALLFPDQGSLDQFREGLAQEAQMHINEQTVLGGSPTADKLADMANIAGVTLPNLTRAMATGRLRRVAGQAIATGVQRAITPSLDQLAAERQRLLVAGANGDRAAQQAALQKMAAFNAGQPSALANAVRGAVNYSAPRLLPSVSGFGTVNPPAQRQP